MGLVWKVKKEGRDVKGRTEERVHVKQEKVESWLRCKKGLITIYLM
jgi:hypothetical protein